MAPPVLGLERLMAGLGVRLRRKEPLAPHTTFRIGGPADWYSKAETPEPLHEIVRREER